MPTDRAWRFVMSVRVAALALGAFGIVACSAAPGGQPTPAPAFPTVAVPSPSSSAAGSATTATGMTPPPAAGTYVDVPGTDIAIAPPDGFSLTEDWSGFQGPVAGASIQVAQLPGPYSEASKVMGADGLLSQGMTLTSLTDVILVDGDGLFAEATQQARGVGFRKILFMFGDESVTTLIVGTMPDANAELFEALKVAVLSAGPRLNSSSDPLEGLPYEVTPSAPLRFAGRISNSVTYNVSGKIPSGTPGEPTFIVAPSLGSVVIEDRAATFQDRIGQLPLDDIELDPPTELTIGGLPGLASMGTAMDSSDRVVEVFVVMLFYDDEYVLMFGQASWLVAEGIWPSFRATAASFALKP